jgi:hypothetical protein
LVQKTEWKNVTESAEQGLSEGEQPEEEGERPEPRPLSARARVAMLTNRIEGPREKILCPNTSLFRVCILAPLI